MRKVVPLVIALTLIPGVASATEIDELLDRGREATYTAEQLTTCTTPDGLRDALVRIEQSGAEIRISGDDETELAIGAGGWALHRSGGVVEEAVVGGSTDVVIPLYVVEDHGETIFMGRQAFVYRLLREEVLRAELVFDVESGAMVRAVTFDADGNVYCDRRFVSFDPNDPEVPSLVNGEPDLAAAVSVKTAFPGEAAGFVRVDQYEDEDGFGFAYYSDGFFSFAVFESPTRVELEGAVTVELEERKYHRFFTAGQAIYIWESSGQGLALVGDLPPDLHLAVLGALPEPTDPGLLRRIWRSLFG